MAAELPFLNTVFNGGSCIKLELRRYGASRAHNPINSTAVSSVIDVSVTNALSNVVFVCAHFPARHSYILL